jgi:hypothetical protein
LPGFKMTREAIPLRDRHFSSRQKATPFDGVFARASAAFDRELDR